MGPSPFDFDDFPLQVARAGEMRRWPFDADCWGIFDNTASGAAMLNAPAFAALVQLAVLGTSPISRCR